MDILIPDQWIREYLETKATKQQIMEYLSLCGPSIEKITGSGKSAVYAVEVTTNRVDSASVYGIAREASSILPRFDIEAKLKPLLVKKQFSLCQKVKYLQVKIDRKLCYRFSAVLIRNVKVGPSPKSVVNKLELVGERTINNVVDVSNYVMHELGQPVHTFDYDKIAKHTMNLRESIKGETMTTLDGKKHKLPGGDIVIEDGEGRIIDLAGIMGGENSAIDKGTTNVLLFVQTYSPNAIRRTSMSLAQRTQAAALFEKGLDPEGVEIALRRAAQMISELSGGKVEKLAVDIYPDPYKPKFVKTDLSFLQQRMGVELSKKEVTKSLARLSLSHKWAGDNLEVKVPSFRAGDIDTEEDILEEVARIYGYFTIPSVLPKVTPSEPMSGDPFRFEEKVRNYLVGWGAYEVYTLSLVGEQNENGIALLNPLGVDSKYLRTSLIQSLTNALNENKGQYTKLHLFEISNVYINRKGDLPNEMRMLGGVMDGYNYREAKGIVEALLEKLNIDYGFRAKGNINEAEIIVDGNIAGKIGRKSNGLIYYEVAVEKLQDSSSEYKTYTSISEYPAQIEDLTFTIPEGVFVWSILEKLRRADTDIIDVQLADIFERNYTFRVKYQNKSKTLANRDVELLRAKAIKVVTSAGARFTS